MMKIRYEKPGIPGIEYSDRALNTHTGCLNGPDVCAVYDDCWARSMAKRLAGRYGYTELEPFGPTIHSAKMKLPMRWRKPSRIHLNFMGDLFSWAVGPTWDRVVSELFTMCLKTPQHRYYMLTKRPDVLAGWCERNGPVPDNVWVGTSISRKKDLRRVGYIALVPAACRWISIEPMLEDVAPHLGLTGIQWVVVGAQTGWHPFQPKMVWEARLISACRDADVPLFIKDNMRMVPVEGSCRQFPAIGPATWEV